MIRHPARHQPFPGRAIRIRKRGCEPVLYYADDTDGRRANVWGSVADGVTFDAWRRLMREARA